MISNRLKFLIFNILGLQITWAACAYGATHDLPMLGVYVGLVYMALHFIFVEERFRDLNVVLLIGALGIILDYINARFGIVSFSPLNTTFLILPYWLITLWLVFSLMIPHSLYWLNKHRKVACIAGAVGGSVSYWMGHKMGALTFSQPNSMSFVIYFIEWGIFFPLSLYIVRLLSRVNLTKSQLSL